MRIKKLKSWYNNRSQLTKNRIFGFVFGTLLTALIYIIAYLAAYIVKH